VTNQRNEIEPVLTTQLLSNQSFNNRKLHQQAKKQQLTVLQQLIIDEQKHLLQQKQQTKQLRVDVQKKKQEIQTYEKSMQSVKVNKFDPFYKEKRAKYGNYLSQLQSSITKRCQVLVEGLISLYIIKRVSDSECSICNITIKDDFELINYDNNIENNQSIAAALGYIVFVLLKIANYSNNYLPYPMIFHASHSTIYYHSKSNHSNTSTTLNTGGSSNSVHSSDSNNIHNTYENEYVLRLESNTIEDIEQFRRAIFLLSHNIISLCLQCGVSNEQLKTFHLLPNMLLLLQAVQLNLKDRDIEQFKQAKQAQLANNNNNTNYNNLLSPVTNNNNNPNVNNTNSPLATPNSVTVEAVSKVQSMKQSSNPSHFLFTYQNSINNRVQSPITLNNNKNNLADSNEDVSPTHDFGFENPNIHKLLQRTIGDTLFGGSNNSSNSNIRSDSTGSLSPNSPIPFNESTIVVPPVSIYPNYTPTPHNRSNNNNNTPHNFSSRAINQTNSPITLINGDTHFRPITQVNDDTNIKVKQLHNNSSSTVNNNNVNINSVNNQSIPITDNHFPTVQPMQSQLQYQQQMQLHQQQHQQSHAPQPYVTTSANNTPRFPHSFSNFTVSPTAQTQSQQQPHGTKHTSAISYSIPDEEYDMIELEADEEFNPFN
jgi:hypothetical protein